MEKAFSDMSYKEQQDRWLEWRSRQLEYREAGAEQSDVPADEGPHLPQPERPEPSHHRNLDQVLARHSQASRRHTPFQQVTPSNISPKQ